MLPEHSPNRTVSLPRRTSRRAAAPPVEHLLQLFDTDESLARAVAAFMRDGAARQETVLLVCTDRHWDAIRGAWGDAAEVDALLSGGQAVVLNAERMLSGFMRHGQPDAALFKQTIETTVDRLAARTPAGLRVYGEMVELLARDGNYSGAARLEELWNRLGRRRHFTLLCGYSSAHFAGPDAGSALATICALHSHAIVSGDDQLADFLLRKHRTARAQA